MTRLMTICLKTFLKKNFLQEYREEKKTNSGKILRLTIFGGSGGFFVGFLFFRNSKNIFKLLLALTLTDAYLKRGFLNGFY
jgi:hypothetical protein